MGLKVLLIILATIAGIFILIEGSLKLIFGFGNPPLYISDEEIGYLLAPNQRVRRLGNLIAINQYSMRNNSIQTTRAASTFRIMLLG